MSSQRLQLRHERARQAAALKAKKLVEKPAGIRLQEPVVVAPRVRVLHELPRREGVHQMEDCQVSHAWDFGVLQLGVAYVCRHHDAILDKSRIHRYLVRMWNAQPFATSSQSCVATSTSTH